MVGQVSGALQLFARALVSVIPLGLVLMVVIHGGDQRLVASPGLSDRCQRLCNPPWLILPWTG